MAINYLPAEEPDAKEVVALIRAEGRKAVAIPGDIRDEAFCKKLVATAVSQLGGLDIPSDTSSPVESTNATPASVQGSAPGLERLSRTDTLAGLSLPLQSGGPALLLLGRAASPRGLVSLTGISESVVSHRGACVSTP